MTLERSLYFATACVALLLIWSQRWVPLQDYPDWVYQGALFADWLRGDLAPAFAWAGTPAPNALSTLWIGALSWMVSAETAGKLLLSAYGLGFLWAGRRLVRTISPSSAWVLLPPILVFNFSFLHGNINYAASLAVFCAALAQLLRCEQDAGLAIPAGFGLLLYLCHGTTYFAFLVLLAALALSRRALPLALALGVALVPALLYGARKLAAPGAVEGIADGFDVASFALFKLSTLAKFFAPFPGFYPFYEPVVPLAPLLVAANLTCFSVIAWRLRGAPGRIFGERRWLGWGLVVLAGLFVFTPRSAFGIVNPGERFLLPIALVLAAFAPEPARERWTRAFLALTLLLELACLTFYTSYVARRLQALQTAVKQHTQGADFALVHESHFREISDRERGLPLAARLLPRHYPALRQPLFVALERRAPAPIFDTGLFIYRGPARVVTSFAELARPDLPSSLIVLGSGAGTRLIEDRVASSHRAVVRGDGFAILRASSGDGSPSVPPIR